MKRLALVVGLLTACGGDATGPESDVSIAGNWSFGENLSAPAFSLSYVGQGQIVLSQGSGQFTGTYDEDAVLTTPDGAFDASSSGNINGGQVDGSRVSFQVSTCDYTGNASGNPANRIEGQVVCDLDVSGQAIRFSGTWQAGR